LLHAQFTKYLGIGKDWAGRLERAFWAFNKQTQSQEDEDDYGHKRYNANALAIALAVSILIQ
jgi:hypothetical protein